MSSLFSAEEKRVYTGASGKRYSSTLLPFFKLYNLKLCLSAAARRPEAAEAETYWPYRRAWISPVKSEYTEPRAPSLTQIRTSPTENTESKVPEPIRTRAVPTLLPEAASSTSKTVSLTSAILRPNEVEGRSVSFASQLEALRLYIAHSRA